MEEEKKREHARTRNKKDEERALREDHTKIEELRIREDEKQRQQEYAHKTHMMATKREKDKAHEEDERLRQLSAKKKQSITSLEGANSKLAEVQTTKKTKLDTLADLSE